MHTTDFKKLMETIANGWNTKNAKQATDCFTENAIYIEPPDKQFFQGKNELYEYFGGNQGFDMTLTWHNLFFDEEKQIGCGEYTFKFNAIHHGVAIVELENDKIKLWREYDTSGELSYQEFINIKGKEFKFTFKDL